MSREQDKAKAKELLKKYSIKKAQKDLEEAKKQGAFAKKLNEKFKQTPTKYSEAVDFALYLSEQIGNKSDVKYLKSLPDQEDDFLNLPDKTKGRLLKITYELSDYFQSKMKENDEEYESLSDKKDVLVKGRVAWLKDEVDELESELSKKDYPTGWECALDIRKMYAEGELPGDVDSITDAYKWGVKHCTVKGKEIPRYTKLAKDYENAKFGRTKSGEVIDAFEEKYYDKIK